MANGVVKRANVLDEAAINEVLGYIDDHSAQPLRDRLMLILTCRLGLRAQEVAKVYVEDILDARGRLKDSLFVSKRGAKYGKERTLPMRDDVKVALQAYLNEYKQITSGPLFFNQYGEPLESTAVQKQLKRLYGFVGLRGCSSHSGRRTFGTRAARAVTKMGGTLKDVMRLMGHASIETTEIYVEFTPIERELVAMI